MVKNENKNFAYTTHRIGGTTYKVKVVFNERLFLWYNRCTTNEPTV